MKSNILRRPKPAPHAQRTPKYTLAELAAFLGIEHGHLSEALRNDPQAPRAIPNLMRSAARYYDRDEVLAWWKLHIQKPGYLRRKGKSGEPAAE